MIKLFGINRLLSVSVIGNKEFVKYKETMGKKHKSKKHHKKGTDVSEGKAISVHVTAF